LLKGDLHDRRMGNRARTWEIMSKAEDIATHDETLKLLTEKAREGSTSAMIALERALRARAREDAEQGSGDRSRRRRAK
jgi:hypothetical protein